MRKYFKNRHKTSHLSAQENADLMQKYYNGVNINMLINEYNLDTASTNISSTFQLIKTPDQICKFCKSEMYYVPPSKMYQDRKEYICSTCFHIDGPFCCECRHCVIEKQDEANKKRILKTNASAELDMTQDPLIQENAISIEELSFTERIYLGAILRCNPLIQHCFFVLDRKLPNNFAPTTPYSNIVLEALIDKGIIFEVGSSEESIKFAINIKNIRTDKNIILNLMYPQHVSTIDLELLKIIRHIQIYESVEYFSFMLIKFNLPHFFQSKIRDKCLLLFTRILSSYSTAQLLNFIYTAIRNQAAKNNRSKQSADILSEIYAGISNRYKMAITDNWSIKNYNRAYKQKVSELSKLVSNDLLEIGEALFYEPFSG